jgi:hypothetical protein
VCLSLGLADPTAEPGCRGAKKGDRLVAKNPHLKVTAFLQSEAMRNCRGLSVFA